MHYSMKVHITPENINMFYEMYRRGIAKQETKYSPIIYVIQMNYIYV